MFDLLFTLLVLFMWAVVCFAVTFVALVFWHHWGVPVLALLAHKLHK